jgi:hypothetical protein
VTSGIVGIIGFAFQLAKTASKVKMAIDGLKYTSKDARELIDRLVTLENVCQLIESHLGRRNLLPNHPLPPSLDVISKALEPCRAKAQELEHMLSKFTSSHGRTGAPRNKLDTVSRFRLVFRKDEITSLVQKIDHFVSLLQFVILVDMW